MMLMTEKRKENKQNEPPGRLVWHAVQVLTDNWFKLTTVVSLDPGLNWQIMITSAEMINH